MGHGSRGSKKGVSRREFLGTAAGAAALSAASQALGALRFLEPVTVDNPLESYPARDWEKTYRDIYSTDSSFVFLCAPNDTHNCLLRAHVKNGIIVRISPTYRYKDARDIYGNTASSRWDPRCCQKGLVLMRRIYGDRRCAFPLVRKGFKAWVDAGFPRDPAGRPPPEYLRRGEDSYVKVSWDEVSGIVARGCLEIAQTYSGEAGTRLLKSQGYDPDMINSIEGAGTKTLKFRGGMPFLGATRIYGLHRMANVMALLDAHIRKVDRDHAKGAKGWDSYSWHTDLPPGHPMVSGQQTVDWELFGVEHAKLALAWGMNWLCTKMPDSHWLTEARLKGTRVAAITSEYGATASKADEVVIIRPGTDTAFALGMAHVVIKEKLYSEDYVRSFTDLPLLVRLDTMTLLNARDIVPGWSPSPLSNAAQVLKKGEEIPPPPLQEHQIIPETLREEWGDFVMWDTGTGTPRAVSRDQVGRMMPSFTPALTGEYSVALARGPHVKAAPVFELISRTLLADYDPDTVSEITWAPKEAVVGLAREVAANRQKTLFACGMGTNQFFNAGLKDRAIFLVAALTENVGFPGGNVGSYSGNYRSSLFTGIPQYIYEDPFDPQVDPTGPVRVRPYAKAESAHYFNYGDRILRMGEASVTGKGHVPAPTKAIWLANSNSVIGNAKWHYDLVANTLPRVEMLVVNEWWWSQTCEYADVVLPVDSWAETKLTDMCASATNPFLHIYPRTPLPRIHDTRSDLEAVALVAGKLADLTGDDRFRQYFTFASKGKAEVYLQRIIEGSQALKGYRIEELEARAREGVPALIMPRTYPRITGYEQTQESRPWYTRSGRLEFLRDEAEFKEHGEALPVYREPVDSTFYEPNVIVAGSPLFAAPKAPEAYGVSHRVTTPEARQARNVVKPWAEVKRTHHPLVIDGFKFIFHTPKYRHGAHTTPVDTDLMALFFGPFTDIYRRDKRMPFVGEGYVDINPRDARALGIMDGDYVWVDADPGDRPYRGWKKDQPFYRVSRLLCRARYYNGTPRRVLKMWFNMYGATPGSVKGQETRPDGLAKNPATGYQAMIRFGSHQSGTRAWLKPTQMTDSLVRKEVFGQVMGKGFLADVHCPTGAPRESFVKIARAEAGGMGGRGLWRPAELGLRPTYESKALAQYLAGGFVRMMTEKEEREHHG